jgi:hypothetical protein
MVHLEPILLPIRGVIVHLHNYIPVVAIYILFAGVNSPFVRSGDTVYTVSAAADSSIRANLVKSSSASDSDAGSRAGQSDEESAWTRIPNEYPIPVFVVGFIAATSLAFIGWAVERRGSIDPTHEAQNRDVAAVALDEAPLRAGETNPHEPTLPHPAPNDSPVGTSDDYVAAPPNTEPRFTAIDANGVASGPFAVATLAGLLKAGALAGNTALVAEDTGAIWNMNDVIREFGRKNAPAGLRPVPVRAAVTQSDASGAGVVDNMSSQSSERINAIIVAVVLGLGIIWAFSLLTGGDTGKAERMIERKYDASNVSCRQLGDVIGTHQWTCTGRWEETDGVAFWANEDDKDMWVGMGSGQ